MIWNQQMKIRFDEKNKEVNGSNQERERVIKTSWISLLHLIPCNLWSKYSSHLQTYVMAAYITSSSVIRLTTIRKCKTIIRLRFHLRINQSKFLTIPLIHKPILKCPWFYATKLVPFSCHSLPLVYWVNEGYYYTNLVYIQVWFCRLFCDNSASERFGSVVNDKP